jgi:hypothetical protein
MLLVHSDHLGSVAETLASSETSNFNEAAVEAMHLAGEKGG